MKALIVLVVLAGLIAAVCFWTWNQGSNAMSVQIAFGSPGAKGIPLDVCLTSDMSTISGPEGAAIYNSVWQQWVNERFTLKDSADNAVPCEYSNGSQLIGGSRGKTDIGYLKATLKPGEHYVFTYRPVPDQPAAFRGELTAPDSAKTPSMLRLAGVKLRR
ncbi:MAG TPA: hypothetical protein VGM03_13260 [Phycisphaerae bacterium]|jgi:hypothetical protein